MDLKDRAGQSPNIRWRSNLSVEMHFRGHILRHGCRLVVWGGIEIGKGFPKVDEEDIFLEKGGVGDAPVVNRSSELRRCVRSWETGVPI